MQIHFNVNPFSDSERPLKAGGQQVCVGRGHPLAAGGLGLPGQARVPTLAKGSRLLCARRHRADKAHTVLYVSKVNALSVLLKDGLSDAS